MNRTDALPAALRGILARLPHIALAFSGGIDSRFLTHAALLCGCDALAIHARGPHVPPADSRQAEAWLKKCGISYIIVHYNPLPLPEVRVNGRERCYACKKGLLATIKEKLAAANDSARTLCDGGQADDRYGYRPGLRAAAEAGVVSPLAEAGMGKAQIRAAARATGMDAPEQKARPCLLTRLAYGLEPQEAVLANVASCEAELEKLFADGRDFRLRLAPRPVLQIAGKIGGELTKARAILAAHGFADATYMECQSVSGFFDGEGDGKSSGLL